MEEEMLAKFQELKNKLTVRYFLIGAFAFGALLLGLGFVIMQRFQQETPKYSQKQQANQNHTGDQSQDWFSDVANLPSCGSKRELFSVAPLNPTDFNGIVPLGTLAPTSHVLPTHHLYFHPRRIDPNNFNSLPVEIPAFAPADITITEIRFTEAKERPDFNDGVIHFSPCREVKGLFDHFKTFSSKLQKAFDEGQILRCDEYQRSYKKFGTLTFKLCNKRVNIQVKAGEQIGTAGGGEGQMVFDFGLFDKRATPATLANPKRWLGQEQKQYTVCPLDYYTAPLKEQLKSRLGTPDGGRKRTAEPVCGQANWDLPGTAQGVWIAKGEEYVAHENPHLALAYDNTDPTIGVISMGNSAESKGFSWGTYNFQPQDSERINRHFKDIKADGNVYCFETDDTYRNNVRVVIMLTMPTSTTLQIEKTNQTSCGGGLWKLTNYAEFKR
ncbi:MAG: hypothetical protein AAB600_02785 [Patescibacteria group bacterium]